MPSLTAGGLVALGLVGLYIFVRYELRIDNPVVDLDLFRHNTVFAFSNLAALVNYAATFAVTFMLSIYLQKIKGLNPQEAGIVLIVQPIVQAILSPMAGRLSDRVEPRTVASVGMALTFVGLVSLVFLDSESSIHYILAVLALLGVGFALFSSPNTNAIMSAVERRYFGVAGALVSAMRQIGMMVSMGIVMLILALLLGQAEIEPAYYGAFVNSMKIAFVVFAVLCFGGIFASLARGRVKPNARQPER